MIDLTLNELKTIRDAKTWGSILWGKLAEEILRIEQETAMMRSKGYYWVQHRNKLNREVGYWDGENWQLCDGKLRSEHALKGVFDQITSEDIKTDG